MHKVYKFRSTDEHGNLNQYSMKILRDGELFLSAPSSFNDVFDTRIEFIPISACTKEEVLRHFSRLEDIFKVQGINFDEAIKSLRTNKGFREIKKNITQLLKRDERTIDFFKVFCFSNEWNNPAMWGYYANSSKGIAIGFETSIYEGSACIDIEPDSFSKVDIPGIEHCPYNDRIPLVNVIYSGKRPTPLNFFKYDIKDMEKFIITKSKTWEQEAESRILACNTWLKNTNPSIIHVATNVINELILGTEASSSLEQQVKALVKDPNSKCYNAKVYRLERILTQFKFKKILIP